jgi:hypothetical protein
MTNSDWYIAIVPVKKQKNGLGEGEARQMLDCHINSTSNILFEPPSELLAKQCYVYS